LHRLWAYPTAMRTIRLPLLCAATCGILFVASSIPSIAAERTPLKIKQTEDARFPDGLLLVPLTHGDAWVMISVDAEGKLTDALAMRYTHEAFANEAVRVLHRWHYDPALVDGQPAPVRMEVHFRFEATGAVITIDPSSVMHTFASFAEKPRYINRVCAADELDQKPVAVRTVAPNHFANATARNAKNEKTVIEFIIDETGAPRMPVLVSAPDMEYANRAAEAITHWQFTPPTRRGRPVAVRVQQAFVYPEG